MLNSHMAYELFLEPIDSGVTPLSLSLATMSRNSSYVVSSVG